MADGSIKMLYDGLCPLCKREVRALSRHDRQGVIEPVDITSPDFDADRYGLSRADVHARMHAILPDGSVVTGMQAFRRVYDAIGMGWRWRWTGWPVLRPIFDLLYAGFAKVRPKLQLSRSCKDDGCRVEPKR